MKWNNMKAAARRAFVAAVIAVIAALATPSAFAQTTGQINGTIVDQQGAAMPGVTVTATSPALQGERSTVTDGTGTFRFLSLPPGVYTIKAELAGFQSSEQTSVPVSLSQAVTVNFTLQVAGVSAQVTVVGASPYVDTTTSSGGITATTEMFNQLPVQRNFFDIARLAAGVTTDAVGPAALGSTGAENQYIIEGLNMTGIVAGQQARRINFDFIKEINVKTEGLNAEYGRFTGTVLEAVTKDGGNAFHGDIFFYGAGGPLQAADATRTLRPQTTTTVANIGHQLDGGFDVGGFIVKDKVWFFGAYDGINERNETTIIRNIAAPGSPAINAIVPADITRQTFAGKLTFNLAKGQSLIGSVNGDPTKTDGNIFAISGPESTWKGTLNTGATAYNARYEGVLGNNWFVQAQYGRHPEKATYEGPGTTIPRVQDNTVPTPFPVTGGFGFFQNQDFKRDEVRADLTKYMGGHTLKGGVDWERVDALVNSFQGGAGQRIYKFSTGGVVYYRHRYYVNDRAPGFVRTDPTTWQIANPLTSEPVDKNTALYVQDSWKALSNLTVEAGVRWERQDLFGRDPSPPVIELKKNWAGRLGVVFDPMNDGKGKIFAHYGRFFENIPMDINIRSFGGELLCFCYNFSPDPANTAPASTAPRRSSLLGGPEPVDPDLKGQYIDEILVGVEREIAPAFVVGARFNYRKLGRVIEDFLVPSSGEYFIANPAEGTLGQSLGFYDGTSVASPQARRTNKSFELTARKRFTNNWQLVASYVWSKLEGNYDGVFQSSTGQLDPNINSAFDYADFLINADGRLTNDRRHQLKFDGSYAFGQGAAKGLNIGVSTRWLSGLPLTAYGYSFAYSNWEYFLTPRGSLGDGPSNYEMDLHVGYPVRFGQNHSLSVVADVFNLFNRQAITTLDQRYNLDTTPCAGIPGALCNDDGGLQHNGATLNPIGQLTNPQATATNPDFLKAGRGFTDQRSLRIGVKLTF